MNFFTQYLRPNTADLVRAFTDLHGAIGIAVDDQCIREKLIIHLSHSRGHISIS